MVLTSDKPETPSTAELEYALFDTKSLREHVEHLADSAKVLDELQPRQLAALVGGCIGAGLVLFAGAAVGAAAAVIAPLATLGFAGSAALGVLWARGPDPFAADRRIEDAEKAAQLARIELTRLGREAEIEEQRIRNAELTRLRLEEEETTLKQMLQTERARREAERLQRANRKEATDADLEWISEHLQFSHAMENNYPDATDEVKREAQERMVTRLAEDVELALEDAGWRRRVARGWSRLTSRE